MDGRGEGMALPPSAPYYLHRGGIGGPDPGYNVHGGSVAAQAGVLQTPPGFKTLSNPSVPGQLSGGSSFHAEDPSPNFPHGVTTAMLASSEPVKKKRGRPRKYGLGPDGSKVSLRLLPAPRSKPPDSATSSGEKARRGRPPGTGWKQKLVPLGEWMNSSAGLAFAPHVLQIRAGEDVAAKVLAFAQQRQRALSIMSCTGSVSAVTLRQPTASGSTITYEGRFEILCLSGSYLVAEGGSPSSRTGGISVSLCSPDGHMIGGAIGGRLIAASQVQVVACSFVYNGARAVGKIEPGTKDERYLLLEQPAEKSLTPTMGFSTRSYSPNSGASIWPPVSRSDAKHCQTDINLMRG